MASGGDIQHFPALNRVDERQNNRAAYFQPFFQRREELSLQDHCILWGNRVVLF